MDPVTLIISALLSGVTASASDVAKAAVKDTYDLFISHLRKRIGSKEDALDALDKVEKKPESEARQEVLREELHDLNIDKDEELIQLAQTILQKLDKQGFQEGKYKVNISGGQGFVIGDHAKVDQHFGQPTNED